MLRKTIIDVLKGRKDPIDNQKRKGMAMPSANVSMECVNAMLMRIYRCHARLPRILDMKVIFVNFSSYDSTSSVARSIMVHDVMLLLLLFSQ
jgi:hypothetical protein